MFRSSSGGGNGGGNGGVVWLGLPGKPSKEEQQKGDPYASKLGGRPVRAVVWCECGVGAAGGPIPSPFVTTQTRQPHTPQSNPIQSTTLHTPQVHLPQGSLPLETLANQACGLCRRPLLLVAQARAVMMWADLCTAVVVECTEGMR